MCSEFKFNSVYITHSKESIQVFVKVQQISIRSTKRQFFYFEKIMSTKVFFWGGAVGIIFLNMKKDPKKKRISTLCRMGLLPIFQYSFLKAMIFPSLSCPPIISHPIHTRIRLTEVSRVDARRAGVRRLVIRVICARIHGPYRKRVVHQVTIRDRCCYCCKINMEY